MYFMRLLIMFDWKLTEAKKAVLAVSLMNFCFHFPRLGEQRVKSYKKRPLWRDFWMNFDQVHNYPLILMKLKLSSKIYNEKMCPLITSNHVNTWILSDTYCLLVILCSFTDSNSLMIPLNSCVEYAGNLE